MHVIVTTDHTTYRTDVSKTRLTAMTDALADPNGIVEFDDITTDGAVHIFVPARDVREIAVPQTVI